MGWTIAAPTLPPSTTPKLAFLTIVYALLEIPYIVITSLAGSVTAPHSQAYISTLNLLSLGTTTCNLVFYTWTFNCLKITRAQLMADNQKEKLRKYDSLHTALSASLLFSCFLITLSILDAMFPTSTLDYMPTQSQWLLEWGGVQIVYALIVCSVCWIWRPVRGLGDTRFMVELSNMGEDDDDDDDMSIEFDERDMDKQVGEGVDGMTLRDLERGGHNATFNKIHAPSAAEEDDEEDDEIFSPKGPRHYVNEGEERSGAGEEEGENGLDLGGMEFGRKQVFDMEAMRDLADDSDGED
jgi:hypothetical protein